jgi:transcription antitermination factor NusG
MGWRRRWNAMSQKFYYEFQMENHMKFDAKVIENVARQMCIVAGLNPEEYVNATDEDTQTLAERRRSFTGPQDVYVPGPNNYQGNVVMEKRTLPGYVMVTSVYPMPRWRTFRPAAFEALLGFYAVKQVLMAGEPVRPDPHPDLDDDDDVEDAA